MGITAAQLTSVTATNFNLIPQGADYFPNGMYLRNAQTGEISQYSGGDFHLVSVPVATKMGLNGSNVVTITAEQYDGISKGSDYFPQGMLLQNSQTGEIDMYNNGQHRIDFSCGRKCDEHYRCSGYNDQRQPDSTKFPRVRITTHRVFISRIRRQVRSRSTVVVTIMSCPCRLLP